MHDPMSRSLKFLKLWRYKYTSRTMQKSNPINQSIDPSIYPTMARSKLPLLLVLAVVTAAVSSAWLPSPASAASDAAAGGEYCRDSLSGLLACRDFMFGGAAAASPACCAAYSAAFDADPFCLCYIADGVYCRSTGYDVNVTHALEIPVSCGLATPPIELCNSKHTPHLAAGDRRAGAGASPDRVTDTD